MLRLLIATVTLALVAEAKYLDLQQLERLVNDYGDEILTHQGLTTHPKRPTSNHFDVTPVEAEDVEDEVDEVPHPVGIHNWGSHLKFGQVSGVSINPEDEPVVFHRGPVVWDATSFNDQNKLNARNVIKEDTIVTLDPDTAEIKSSFGGNTFYMPHGITVDAEGNTFVTDVGLHQVMRFPKGATKPDLILGEAFIPGSDNDHFCMPTKVAVAKSGVFFVADGYCNSRVLKFNKEGKLLKVINGKWQVVHSLALFEDEDTLCLSDREGQKIECLRAGLTLPAQADVDETGHEVITFTGVGRTYAIAAKGTALLSVNNGPNFTRGITIDTAAQTPKILDSWGIEEGLTAPHDLAISLNGDAVYVAEIDPTKKINLQKFEVVRSADFI